MAAAACEHARRSAEAQKRVTQMSRELYSTYTELAAAGARCEDQAALLRTACACFASLRSGPRAGR